MAKIEITVLKRMFNQDLSGEYALPGNAPCELFSEGQEFFVRGLAKPEGFCDWAWDDIHKCVMTLLFGGDFGCWMKKGLSPMNCPDAYFSLKPLMTMTGTSDRIFLSSWKVLIPSMSGMVR